MSVMAEWHQLGMTAFSDNTEGNLQVRCHSHHPYPLISVRVELFFSLSEPDDAQATGLYVLVGLYYLISTTCTIRPFTR